MAPKKIQNYQTCLSCKADGVFSAQPWGKPWKEYVEGVSQSKCTAYVWGKCGKYVSNKQPQQCLDCVRHHVAGAHMSCSVDEVYKACHAAAGTDCRKVWDAFRLQYLSFDLVSLYMTFKGIRRLVPALRRACLCRLCQGRRKYQEAEWRWLLPFRAKADMPRYQVVE